MQTGNPDPLHAQKDGSKANLAENCVPESFMDMDVSNYQVFLNTRRTMMAQYIREYCESLVQDS